MVTKKAIIKNKNGIHVRPSQMISMKMLDYSGSVTITSTQSEIDDMNTISIISMGLVQDDTITIRVSGPNEEAIGEKLVTLFEYEYDFPPREQKEI